MHSFLHSLIPTFIGCVLWARQSVHGRENCLRQKVSFSEGPPASGGNECENSHVLRTASVVRGLFVRSCWVRIASSSLPAHHLQWGNAFWWLAPVLHLRIFSLILSSNVNGVIWTKPMGNSYIPLTRIWIASVILCRETLRVADWTWHSWAWRQATMVREQRLWHLPA